MARTSLRRPLLGLLLWSGLALFFASEAALKEFPSRQPAQLPWADALLINFTFYLLWGALSLPILALSRRFPIRGAPRWRHVGLHAGLALLFSLGQLVLAEGVFEVVRMTRATEIAFLDALMFSVRHNFHVNVLTYWALVAVRHLRDYDQGLREKELVASRLREQLARAELAALRMQLHPHFLFNALHSISALVHRDAARADAMLVQLSHLLRRSLDARTEAEVTLGRELDFVRGYLELAAMRHGDRLLAEISVPSALLGARVPSFVLQPLVENAVVHGVERSAQPCRVVVRAALDADRLVIEVENDLPVDALPSDHGSSGIGLASVRARLDALHDGAAGLVVELDPGRRALARIVLPFQEIAQHYVILDARPKEIFV